MPYQMGVPETRVRGAGCGLQFAGSKKTEKNNNYNDNTAKTKRKTNKNS